MPTKTQQKIQTKSKVQAELQQMQQVQSELKGLFACFCFFFLGGGWWKTLGWGRETEPLQIAFQELEFLDQNMGTASEIQFRFQIYSDIPGKNMEKLTFLQVWGHSFLLKVGWRELDHWTLMEDCRIKKTRVFPSFFPWFFWLPPKD